MSKLDWFWRRLIVTKLYTQGWGKAEDMKRIFHLRKKLGKREICRHLVSPDHPVYIDKEVIDGNCRLLEGHFMSPLTTLLPGIMPKEVEIARFQMVLPKEWKTDLRPLCVQMGGTGDHGFGRRRKWFAKPLLQEEGIASLILENPFYGCRRPKHQFRSSLHNVSDLFVMGGCLILESLVIFNWLDKLGYGPLGASGISMGGHTACLGSTNWHKPLSLIPIMSGSTAAGVFTHMASLGATNWHKPLSLIPCMSGSTAAGTFTHGVLSTAIPWDLLMKQYMSDETYHREIMELIESPEPYWNGKHDSMYKEGRQYFHDMEDACDSDSEAKLLNQNSLESDSRQSSLSASVPSFENGRSVINQSESRTESCDYSKEDRMIRPDELIGSHTTRSWMNTLIKHIPYLSTWSNKEKDEASKQLELDCKHFMRGVMDECTHLGNFSIPVDPELIIIVLAENDEYIPSKGYQKLHEIWPGSQLRTMSTGHISGFFTGLKEFRRAVGDSFELHAIKYYNTKIRQTS